MNIHFIAIGGSIMHNLAISLNKKGHIITGSDDEIYDPARSQLEKHGLLPEKLNWNINNIKETTDAVILGMHAKKDNPELLEARGRGIPVYSFPEFIFNESKDKKRIVIAGSHGKTSITSMIMHVLNALEYDFDYLVGARIEGFDQMTKLSDAPVIILEGDEYLSSPLDLRSKFIHYKPHVTLISGIAWDHINVFKTFDDYCQCFRDLIDSMQPDGKLIYYKNDDTLKDIVYNERNDINKSTYEAFPHAVKDGITYIIEGDEHIPLKIFGKHNMENLNAAWYICKDLGISKHDFIQKTKDFKGAAKRLEIVKKGDKSVVYKDFAHAPSKLKASTNAVKELYPDRKLTACMELHTFSSLNKRFLDQYSNSMALVDDPIIYINPKYFDIKGLPRISEGELIKSFNCSKLKVYYDHKALKQYLLDIKWEMNNLLMMSSGNFNGIDIEEIADKIIK
ncbi:MAG TPA: peptidoglycan synthetase [Bacteroidetes bacterium]|nr:peptidoglycan synthetase [Bacteroidota bacterium]